MLIKAEIATTTGSETEVAAPSTIDHSYPAQLGNVLPVDNCGAGDGSRTYGGGSVLARSTER